MSTAYIKFYINQSHVVGEGGDSYNSFTSPGSHTAAYMTPDSSFVSI